MLKNYSLAAQSAIELSRKLMKEVFIWQTEVTAYWNVSHVAPLGKPFRLETVSAF